MCTSEAKFIINSTIGAICTMSVNELYKEKQNNVLERKIAAELKTTLSSYAQG